MTDLSSKTIVITGASKGIGRAVALTLAAKNCNLGLIARSEKELQQLQNEINGLGSRAAIFIGSVSDEAFVQACVKSMEEQFGNIDILINNAGFGVFGLAEDISAADWDDVFATNVKGTFLFCKAVIPAMKKRKSGHIVNIASDVAKRTFAGGSAYCATKFAQDAFSAAIRKELQPFGVKVSVVYSGLVDSYFHADPQGSDTHKDWLKNEDMANAIAYIISQPKHVVVDEFMIHPISQAY